MTCNRIIALLALTGISFLGLAGCESHPYKSWQPDEPDNQAGMEAGDTQAAKETAGTVQTQTATPAASEQAAPMDTETQTTTTGDVLLIDSIQSAPAIKVPHNGMNMASVRKQFGDPKSEDAPVGDPPITRWEYDGFSVFFEYDLVLHSVIHHPNQN